MLFFGFYFLLARTPDKTIFANYLRSRRIMGVAMLLLSANYAVHLFCQLRFADSNAAILMNMSTYFLCYWLFSSALTSLLDRFYITRRRFAVHLLLWAVFTVLAGITLLHIPGGLTQSLSLIMLAIWLFAYGIWLAIRLIRTYRKAVRFFDDYHSEHIGAYIRWLSIFTWWAVIFGIGCGLLTFLPDQFIFLWVISSIPFYIYLYHSYMNYLLFYEKVERVLESSDNDSDADEGLSLQEEKFIQTPAFHTDIENKLETWIESGTYVQPGISIKDLADSLNTNRTYLSAYIKSTYNLSFREWIANLRISYAKDLILQYPNITITDVSRKSGFMSLSNFMKTFKDSEGCSPAKWRNINKD